MKRRFKTKQEFIKEFGEDWRAEVNQTWSPNGDMDYLFGLPFSGNVSSESIKLYEELAPDSPMWTVSLGMLTEEPHPYDNYSFKIRVTPAESEKVQKKLFALGYTWFAGETKVLCTDAPYLIFSAKCITYSHNNECFNATTSPEITFQEFWEGAVVDSCPNKRPDAADALSFAIGGMINKPKSLNHLANDEKLEIEITSPQMSEQVQKLLFKLGKQWEIGGQEVRHTDAKYIYASNTPRILKNDIDKGLSGYGITYIHIMDSDFLREYDPSAPEPIINKSSNIHLNFNQNGRNIKVQRPTPTITGGKRPEGSRILGRTSKTASSSGYLSYEGIHC